MENIQVIKNEKNLSNQFFLVICFFLHLLSDQKNFGHQINGEDQPYH
jgi:hypothetical protein